MNLKLNNKILLKFKNYEIAKIESGASKRFFYRISNESHSFICMDSGKEKKTYKNFLKIHSYLTKINISIPKIEERYDDINILILEDFGGLRYDKILHQYKIKDLLEFAVKTLVTIKNEFIFKSYYELPVYNYNIFIEEISELINYFYPYFYHKKISKNLKKEFYECWKTYYDSINFQFDSFSHKDFNINNLLFLPSRKGHLKCGVIDFQSAFLGESCWDLFSLLEDSRIYFDNSYNNYFIEYFFNNSNLNVSMDEFKLKYYMLNFSRQTRLLGRWVKLSNNLNQKFYLNFIDTTKRRLFDNIGKIQNKELKDYYNRIIFNNHEK